MVHVTVAYSRKERSRPEIRIWDFNLGSRTGPYIVWMDLGAVHYSFLASSSSSRRYGGRPLNWIIVQAVDKDLHLLFGKKIHQEKPKFYYRTWPFMEVFDGLSLSISVYEATLGFMNVYGELWMSFNNRGSGKKKCRQKPEIGEMPHGRKELEVIGKFVAGILILDVEVWAAHLKFAVACRWDLALDGVDRVALSAQLPPLSMVLSTPTPMDLDLAAVLCLVLMDVSREEVLSGPSQAAEARAAVPSISRRVCNEPKPPSTSDFDCCHPNLNPFGRHSNVSSKLSSTQTHAANLYYAPAIYVFLPFLCVIWRGYGKEKVENCCRKWKPIVYGVYDVYGGLCVYGAILVFPDVEERHLKFEEFCAQVRFQRRTFHSAYMPRTSRSTLPYARPLPWKSKCIKPGLSPQCLTTDFLVIPYPRFRKTNAHAVSVSTLNLVKLTTARPRLRGDQDFKASLSVQDFKASSSPQATFKASSSPQVTFKYTSSQALHAIHGWSSLDYQCVLGFPFRARS
ncbi:hypothetical protein B0H16DRAFT_1455249 [Mycena metata]|uniref:Uncharacterized protein n=1 Tax=Mycena metata TaxID=1033252 RepID=A0AAD7JET6_9AGAR|nr:hypothetical protein B0H16DRAFT_1455249 [Mycena metata]